MDSSVKGIAEVLDTKDAKDIVILDIAEVSNLTSYFVIATANSEPHMEALRDAVLEFLEKNNLSVIYYDRGRGYDWMVVDGGHFIVHLFSEKGREFYSLEDLWLNAKRYSLEDILKR
ncbi:Iojap-like protein [Kosmotoga pacifica]|uniref:Ribosomal silencing factor RsfS n=1 Tax=Kosmotoga pacifica TaxID=1330330 RepID=A0A0G2ZAN7_9BACT|nr:ribosome silencing factor [Kosmotoga pacifica]AKI97156.1 Iojap-like protein [Kosmotoga pacifica]